MSRDDASRAADILEAIDAVTVAVDVMNAHGSGDPITDICLDAITYRVFTIGEATKSLSTAATGAHPDVPWSNIARMRDLIGHHYYRRDPQVILATIRDPLTQLGDACAQIASTTAPQTDTST